MKNAILASKLFATGLVVALGFASLATPTLASEMEHTTEVNTVCLESTHDHIEAEESSDVLSTISSEIPGTESMEISPQGLGVFWKCATCGYKSATHAFAATAQANANAHMANYPGHRAAVYYG